MVAENDEEEDEPFCRYCFEEHTENNPLITPCACRGSQEWIHEKCLNLWRERWPPTDRRHTHCPVCLALWNVPGPRTLNLGKKYILCSWVYIVFLLTFNINTVLWFILLETGIESEDNAKWCLPAVMGIGMFNATINTLATTHLTSQLRLSELSVGVVLFIINGVGFFSGNRYLIFGASWTSFFFAISFVSYSFRRSCRNAFCRGCCVQ